MKYAIVDLEATGTGSTAKIIQVGIVILENGEIKQTYQTDINPHEALEEHIKQLTGLSDQRLSQAPDFSQVAREIYELIEDAVFVAHNVKFDANLLAESLFWEGFDLLSPRVDTVELAQVVFPTYEKYGLSSLCELLEIPLEQAHTAISDAMATALLFLKIQEKIQSLPKPLLERLLVLSDSLIYESRLVLEDCFEKMPDGRACDWLDCHGIYLKKQAKVGKERYLSTDFAKNISLLGLEERPEQQKFASLIEGAIKNPLPNFLQAQAGLGKTYGYLLPLLAHCQEKIVVSVPTKLLQDQIATGEGRAIEEVFQVAFHSLKSPKSYIKLDTFYQILERLDDNRLLNRCKMQLLVWLTETKTGDLEEIGQAHRYQAFFEEIGHDGQLSKKSLFYGVDFWQIGQEKARESRVLLTNHAYLLTRLEDDKSLIEGRILVVDEAQKLFLALESFSQKSLKMNQLLQTIQQEILRVDSLLERRLLESLQFELAQLVEVLHNERVSEVSDKTLLKLRQDLSELPDHYLPELREILDHRYEKFWLEDEYFEQHRVTSLHAARLSLMNFQDFLPERVQLFFISATLEISRKVNLAQLLGFQAYQFYHLPAKNYHQQRIWVDKDFPDLADLPLPHHAQLIVERIESLYDLNLPILVLFTSKELLLEVSENLSLQHLAQYKNGDASNIKRRFDRGEAQILLGTGSFWEGTDFSSQDKMIQIITRLPFDNPQNVFTQKMNRRLRLEGKNPFYDYSLSVAILRLKQALGRTVRHRKQQSAVLILDNRVYTKRYSRQIRGVLSKTAPIEQSSFHQIRQDIGLYFKKKIVKKKNE